MIDYKESHFTNEVLNRNIFYVFLISFIAWGGWLMYSTGVGAGWLVASYLLWKWQSLSVKCDELMDAASAATKQHLELHLLYYNWLEQFIEGTVDDEHRESIIHTFSYTKEVSKVLNNHAEKVYGLKFREPSTSPVTFKGKHDEVPTDEV